MKQASSTQGVKTLDAAVWSPAYARQAVEVGVTLGQNRVVPVAEITKVCFKIHEPLV